MSLTFYGVLRVPRSAQREQIHAAYIELARTHHPDKGGSHDAMAALTQAWAMLRDADKRASYDKLLDLLGTKCGDCNGEGQRWKQKGFTARIGVFCQSCNGEGFTAMKKTKGRM